MQLLLRLMRLAQRNLHLLCHKEHRLLTVVMALVVHAVGYLHKINQ